MRRSRVVFCAVAFGFFSFAVCASASTIAVTTTEPGINEDGLCSFAEAIENAHAGDVYSDCAAGSGMGDVVELAQGATYPQQPGDSYDVSGVIINGNGSTLSANGGWEGLVAVFVGTTLSDLTIRDAYFGLVLFLGDQPVLLQGCVFEENDSGLYVFDFGMEGIELVVRDSQFLGNSEYAVGFDGESSCGARISFVNSVFIQNETGLSLPFSDCDPGDPPNVVVSGCTFEDNEITAIDAHGSSEVRGCQISNNRKGVAGSGVIEGCTISDNETGVYIHSGGVIRDSRISGNSEGVSVWLATDSVTLQDSRIYGNSLGVKIWAQEGLGGSARLISDTISDNETGILVCQGHVSSGSVTVESSTISGNTYGFGQPDATCRGAASVRDSTIVGNEIALAGLTVPGIYYDVRNSILSSTDRNCSFDFSRPWGWAISRGLNVTNDDSCEFDDHTDMIVNDVMLSELGDYGGKAPVHMPLEGSPVIDMGGTDCPGKDQRGYKRPTDGDGDGVAMCDCGAVESNSYPLPTPYEQEALTAVDE